MTFLEFKDLVDDHLVVDANRKGTAVQTYKTQLLRQACIDIQEDVEYYRQGHETIYEQADVGIENDASKGALPEGANLQEAWMIRKNIDDVVVDQWRVGYCDWVERHLLINRPTSSETGTSNSCVNADYNVYTNFCRSTPYGIIPVLTPYISISPQIDTFYLSPRLDGTVITVASITSSGTTATVTTDSPHGFITGDNIEILLADESEYNGEQTITVPDGSTTTFTYTITGSPASPDTSTTITARNVTNPLTLLLVWDGMKLDFEDSDEVPFDERMALAVSYFVKADIERVQGEAALFNSYDASYRKMKANLFLQKKNQRRISRMRDRTPRPSHYIRQVPTD